MNVNENQGGANRNGAKDSSATADINGAMRDLHMGGAARNMSCVCVCVCACVYVCMCRSECIYFMSLYQMYMLCASYFFARPCTCRCTQYLNKMESEEEKPHDDDDDDGITRMQASIHTYIYTAIHIMQRASKWRVKRRNLPRMTRTRALGLTNQRCFWSSAESSAAIRAEASPPNR
jgi:hypothetical protein